jgi:hypothetical protein
MMVVDYTPRAQMPWVAPSGRRFVGRRRVGRPCDVPPRSPALRPERAVFAHRIFDPRTNGFRFSTHRVELIDEFSRTV